MSTTLTCPKEHKYVVPTGTHPPCPQCEAYAMGQQAAATAASWAADGNTTQEHIRRVLAMIEEGDPAAEQLLPRRPDLSGEYADAPTPTSVARDIVGEDASPDVVDVIAAAWAEGVSDTFQGACEAELLRWCGDGC